jgi:hypothetical protein
MEKTRKHAGFSKPMKPASPRPASFTGSRTEAPGKRFNGILKREFNKKLCTEHQFVPLADSDMYGTLKSTYDIKRAKYTGPVKCINSKATAVYENGVLVEFDAGIVFEEESLTR